MYCPSVIQGIGNNRKSIKFHKHNIYKESYRLQFTAKLIDMHKKTRKDFEAFRISKMPRCMQVLPFGSQIYKADLLFAVLTAGLTQILSHVNFIKD